MAKIEKLTLKKKKNDYDEFSVIAWKNGKKYEEGTYYTDDWEDAVGTLKQMAKQMSLTIRPNGTGYVADSKVKDFDAINDPMYIKELQQAIELIKVGNYKKAKFFVDDVSNLLKYRI